MSNGMDYCEFLVEAAVRGAIETGDYRIEERYSRRSVLISVHAFAPFDEGINEVGYWHPGISNLLGPIWFDPHRVWHHSFYEQLLSTPIPSLMMDQAQERVDASRN